MRLIAHFDYIRSELPFGGQSVQFCWKQYNKQICLFGKEKSTTEIPQYHKVPIYALDLSSIFYREWFSSILLFCFSSSLISMIFIEMYFSCVIAPHMLALYAIILILFIRFLVHDRFTFVQSSIWSIHSNGNSSS